MESAVSGGSALSLAELSRRTGLSRSAVLRRVRRGDIQGATRRDDGQWEIPEAAVAVMLDPSADGVRSEEQMQGTPVDETPASDDVGEPRAVDLTRTQGRRDGDALVGDGLADADADADADVVDLRTEDLHDAESGLAVGSGEAARAESEVEPGSADDGAATEAASVVTSGPTSVTTLDVRERLDVRPSSLDLELERGLRAELADARRQAAVAEAVADERLETIETLRQALETIRRVLPAVEANPMTDVIVDPVPKAPDAGVSSARPPLLADRSAGAARNRAASGAAAQADAEVAPGDLSVATSSTATSEPGDEPDERIDDVGEWVWQTTADDRPRDWVRRIFHRR